MGYAIWQRSVGILKRQQEEDSWKFLELHCSLLHVYAKIGRIEVFRRHRNGTCRTSGIV